MKKSLILTLIVMFFASFTSFAQSDAQNGKKQEAKTEKSKDNKKVKVAGNSSVQGRSWPF